MNDPNETPTEPKIIVDSDWKEQVAQEKEKLKNESLETASDEGSPPAESDEPKSEAPRSEATPPQTSAPETSGTQPELPPASFEVLVSMLFTQALSALGQMPGPSGETARVDKPMAKHTIDTLEMLQEKTKGNLTDEEVKMVGEALHALRMTYVSVRG